MANPSQVGSFVPTTNVWDISELYSVEVTSPRFKELLVRLYQKINLMAIVLNTKDSGYYDQSEFVNGQIWFSDPALDSTSQLTPSVRQVFRTVVNFGALPNAGTKSVAHNIPITDAVTFTRIYGVASDTSAHSYIPLPYASTIVDHIELYVDGTNVNVVTLSNRTNYTVCYIVVEYLKQ